MKIAFVGKGGSGKSTTSSLFIKYLLSRDKKILAIDADINMHMAPLLRLEIDAKCALSQHGNPARIRKYLKGENKLIEHEDHFVKTTPPGNGSNLITLESNYFTQTFGTPLGIDSYFMFVGSYSEEEIGVACYHTNLSILENILSHTFEKDDEWIVVDMVAGTDAFSGSLHLQFDAIFLIVEPTPESTSVYLQYTKLAQKAGVLDRIFVVGNKVEDTSDEEYIKNVVGEKLIGHMPLLKSLRKARQENRQPELSDLPNTKLFQTIAAVAKKQKKDPKELLDQLYTLHRKHAQEEWVVNLLGDVTSQIDTTFTPPPSKK